MAEPWEGDGDEWKGDKDPEKEFRDQMVAYQHKVGDAHIKAMQAVQQMVEGHIQYIRMSYSEEYERRYTTGLMRGFCIGTLTAVALAALTVLTCWLLK